MTEVVPAVVNLAGQKPICCKSYARRFRCVQNPVGQGNGADTQVQIPIDVSTPGGFIDCKSSYLQFDLTLTNSNYCIDFQNWPTCGAQSIIERLEIVSNGTPIEQIYDYGTMVNKIMELAGAAGTRYYFFKPRCDAEDKEGMSYVMKGPCKPPMVDYTGAILNAQQGPNRFSSHGQKYLPDNSGAEFPTTIAFNNTTVLNPPTSVITNAWCIGYGPANLSTQEDIAFNYPQSASINSILRNTLDINGWPWNIGYAVPRCDKTVSQRTQDAFYYFANMKRFPIPVSPLNFQTVYSVNTNATGTGNSELVGTAAYASASYVYTVIMPLYSGVIGQWMPRYFPGFLCSDLMIRITLARNDKVFQVTMDPCNLVRGTHRDFVTYQGGKLYGASYPSTDINTNGGGTAWYFPYFNLGSEGVEVVDPVSPTTNFDLGTYINRYFYGTSQIGGLVTPATAALSGGITMTSITFTNNIISNIFCPANGPNVRWQSTTTGQGFSSPNLVQNTGYLQGGQVPQIYLPPFGYYPAALRNVVPPADATTPGTFPSATQATGPVGFDSDQIYGTKLRASEDQAWRCVRNGWSNPTWTFNQSTATYPTLTQTYGQQQFSDGQQNQPSYTVSNIYYVMQQIILPDDITSQILSNAASGDISIQTKTVKVYENLQVGTSANQLINVYAKIASADALIAMFRMDEQTNSSAKRNLYNSFAGVNPLGGVLYKNDTSTFIGTGSVPTVYYPPAQSGFGFSTQLRIGTNLVPYQPMTSIQEVMVELEKISEDAFGRFEKLDYRLPMIIGPAGTNAAGKWCFDPEADNCFTTGWTDPYALDDQTIVNDAATILIGQNYPCGVPVGQYICRHLRVPEGQFCLGYNLASFPGSQDVGMDGYYLGVQTVSIDIQGMWLAANANTANTGTQHNMSATVIIPCDMRVSFQAGGNVQSFV